MAIVNTMAQIRKGGGCIEAIGDMLVKLGLDYAASNRFGFGMESKELKHLLNKVNRVTSNHRHGRAVTEQALDDLANAQIDYEQSVKVYNNWDDDK